MDSRFDKDVLFSTLTYGAIDPFAAQSQRLAIAMAGKAGLRIIGDMSPDHADFENARNMVVDTALELKKSGAKIDGVFWADSDIVLPNNAITQLVGHGLDFVSGVYFQKGHPYRPLFGLYNGKKVHFFAEVPENKLFYVDGVGFGCVYTSIDLLERMKKHHEKVFEYKGALGLSEDFDFCIKAGQLGTKPVVDTTVLCKHGHEVRYVGITDFLSTKDRYTGKPDEQILPPRPIELAQAKGVH